jgi:hypothetical protein
MAMLLSRAISHRKADTQKFIETYFGSLNRKLYFIGAAGFDPRSSLVAIALANTGVSRRATFLREDRPNPSTSLLARAEENLKKLVSAFPDSTVSNFNILDPTDSAVIGGRRVTAILQAIDFRDTTDVVVDLSALSIGVSFPMVRYLRERLEAENISLHLFVVPNAEFDAMVEPAYAPSASYIHGFAGSNSSATSADAAKLWIPQLSPGKRGALQKLHEFVQPDDTLPILPFPAKSARTGDRLIVEYLEELESSWDVDARNFLYAAEEEPLDVYRTLLRIDESRERVFKHHGGSIIVLSPIGSKVLALGALLAALERNFPVAYLESMGYNLSENGPQQPASIIDAIHVCPIPKFVTAKSTASVVTSPVAD